MTKLSFLMSLRDKLTGLPQPELEERLRFYSEMIEDRMEEGLSEEEAVAAVGDVDEIAAEIAAEIPVGVLSGNPSGVLRAAPLPSETGRSGRGLKPWVIVLLVLGAPIWLSLGFAAVCVLFSLYVILWSVLVSLWAVFVSLAASAVGILAFGIFSAAKGEGIAAIALLGAGLICAGLTIFLFVGCKAAGKGVVSLTKRSILWIKSRFGRKEEA